MRTILVAYEERPVSGRVLERAALLARAFGAHVLVTSVAPVIIGRGVDPIDPADSPEHHAQELEDARARLQELGVTDVETLPARGSVPKAIAELAEIHHVDLIVLGAHEGGIVSRLLVGSVSDAVAHRAHTDVLIVH